MEKLLKLAKQQGLLRPRDLKAACIPRVYLKQLVERGGLLKTGRGLYVRADASLTENHSLAEAAKLSPRAVVCLLSALRFHELTTENPAEVWIAVPRGDRPPKSSAPALRVMRFSGQMMSAGIEKHVIKGVTVRVYSVAKTVADCFKYRNKIGLDVAIEALRECRRNRKCKIDDLWTYAKICRVANVMRPYLEPIA
jgi:predicted transcriptional regulator of viral defense system